MEIILVKEYRGLVVRELNLLLFVVEDKIDLN